MNTRIMIAGILFCFTLTGIISAQPKPHSKEEKLNHLKELLQLNDEQLIKIESIFNLSEEKMKQLNEKRKAGNYNLNEEMKTIRDEEGQEIAKVLDENQKEKFNVMNKERMKRRPPMDKGKGSPQINKPLN